MSGYGFTSAGTSYDDEDRLTGYARTSGTFTQSWNLTKVGDWTSVTTNGTAQNRTHGPTHELLTAGGQNVSTDVKGNITLLPLNLTPQSSPLALIWDFDNKLRGADLGNNSSVDVNFQYDALGRRVARTGTGGSVVYVQHDQQTIADYPVGGVATTPTYRYVYASYIDEPVVRKAAGTSGTIHYYHRNQQYSITAMTTSTGAVADRYAYTAYGQPTILNASASVLTSSAVGNRYTYTGREWDETLGLHHFRARWMSPLAGRFLGRDPIGYEDGNSLYLVALMFDRVDATGTTAIKLTKTVADLPRTCGSTQMANWRFSIDKKGDSNSGPCQNGYEGYLIQHVEMSCGRVKCSDCDECPKADSNFWIDAMFSGVPEVEKEEFSYFEAWKVTKKGDVVDVSSTDSARVQTVDDSCGYGRQNGTVRFYCKEDVDISDWHQGGTTPDKIKKYGKLCPTSPVALPSIDGQSDVPFWNKKPVAEADLQMQGGAALASRFLHVTWGCCKKQKHWVDVIYAPN
jgi:RHS repeat-associated protein